MRRLGALLLVMLGGQATGSCFDTSIDYPGLDINPSTGRNRDRRDSAAECQELCRHTSGCNFFTWKKSRECWLKKGISSKNTQEGAISGPSNCGTDWVRLSSYPRGRVELYKNGQWGTLCGHYWWDNQKGAENICKELGYAGGIKYTAPGGSGPILAGNRLCNGAEATVWNCPLQAGRTEAFGCTHDIDQGVSCTIGIQPLEAVSATMSSIINTDYPAEKCIDGVLRGGIYSLCHTHPEKAPWLALDFGAQVLVEKVVIYNRDDGFGDRLSNAEVRVVDQLPASGREMFSRGQLFATFAGPGEDGQVVTLASSTGIGGRFVIVQLDHSPGTGYLNLNEVTVWGRKQASAEVFRELASGLLCSTATNTANIIAEEQCQAASAALNMVFDTAWDGPGDFPGCLHANDGRNLVYWNTSPTPSLTAINPMYGAICISLSILFDENNPEPISVEQIAQWRAEDASTQLPSSIIKASGHTENGLNVPMAMKPMAGRSRDCVRGCYWHVRGRRCMSSLGRGRCLN